MGDGLVPVEQISDIWDDVLPNDLHNEGGVQLKKGKKPEKLVNRIFECTTNEGDIILDYVSLTVLDVAVQNGKSQFIPVHSVILPVFLAGIFPPRHFVVGFRIGIDAGSKTIKVVVRGKFRRYVGGKDLILRIITDIGVDGANYKAFEFHGDVCNIPVADRLAISNMAIEAGGKAGIFPCDDLTREYIKDTVRGEYTPVDADPDASYCRVLEYDLDELEPMVAYPHLPSNGRPVREADVRIDQAYLGSCTNGRIEDMRIGAEIVKGRKVAPGVRFLVVPASQKVYRQMVEEGLMQIFLDAGAFISGPTCGACLGGYMGILAAGEKAVSSTNRNFIGRMGDKASEVYLAGPAVVAASAIAGRIVTPDQLEGN